MGNHYLLRHIKDSNVSDGHQDWKGLVRLADEVDEGLATERDCSSAHLCVGGVDSEGVETAKGVPLWYVNKNGYVKNFVKELI